LLLGIILVNSSAVFAQVETATVSGVITDHSGGAVVGAEVRITNSDTNVTSTTTSNQSGIYLVPGLKPGRYRVHVAKEGFKGIDLTELILNAQDSVSRKLLLQIDSVSETISVEGGAPFINTESATVSTVVDRRFVENMPLNGRRFNPLLQPPPGLIIAPSNADATPGQFSINGQRTNANSFQVDAVSANLGTGKAAQERLGGGAQAFNTFGGTSSLVLVGAMQEFRIRTSSFAPECGRTLGGQVNIVMWSGTNQFHGMAFNYLRNDVFDANDWFANAAAKRHAPECQNDFGGVFGRLILRDERFFFFSYEGLRFHRQDRQDSLT